MKVCEYCRTKAADDAFQCNSCGSREFNNICRTCSTEFSGEICPDCRVDSTDRRQGSINNPIPQPQPIPQQSPTMELNAKIIGFILILLLSATILSIIVSNIGTENGSQEVVLENLSDMELLTMKDHPKFYGDHNEAKQFWKGYDKVKVNNASQTIHNEDALLSVTTGAGDKRIITSVRINLSNVDNKHDLKLEDVLQLICDYIPYDILSKYYTFKESFHEKYKGGDYEAYHYVMVLNDAGKAANKSGDMRFNDKFAFKIIHRNENDWIAEINSLSYEGNQDQFKPGAYDVEGWNVAIYKYRS